MKYLAILAFAACAAYGALIGGAGPAQATPMAGLLLNAPAVRTLERLDTTALPVEKAYHRYRRHYRHRYYRHRHYWHRRYYRPYWHRRYYYPNYYHRRHPFYW